jgi:hypothetical protein
MDLSISSNDRVLITGKTGTGKTYLAERLTRPLSRLLVIDSKGTLKGWDLDPIEECTRKFEQKDGTARARALPPLKGDFDEWKFELFERAYMWGNLTVYIDEMYAIVPPNTKAPTSLIACYTRGREYGIGIWASTQRPVWIPLFSLSEAEHFFVFRLMLEEDRKRMAAFMGPTVLSTIRDEHGFFYSAATDDIPQYFKKFKSE